MDEALAIRDYLPNSFKNLNDADYIAFLWETFESNYDSRKYQFAMLACHMLYMSYVYFSVWQIKLSRSADFANAIIFQQKEKELLSASSPFTFSEVQERSIFKFLRLAGCEQQHIAQFQKLVDERNDIAHSNGHIFFSSQTTADRKIGEILAQIAAIQTHMRPVIHDCLKRFLLESYKPDEREYYDNADQIREMLIHTNYFSLKDIEDCMSFDINSIADHEHFEEIKALFEAFKALYPPNGE
jgi:hypothetical protein